MSGEGPDKFSEGQSKESTQTGAQVHQSESISDPDPSIFEIGSGDVLCRSEHKRSIGDHSLDSISSGNSNILSTISYYVCQ